jgi:glucose/arabinose dehydrogenase
MSSMTDRGDLSVPRRLATLAAGVALAAAVAAPASATQTAVDGPFRDRTDVITAAPADAQIALVPRVSGLTRPVFITSAHDGTGRMFVVTQGGLIRVLKNGSLLSTPFLSLVGSVSTGSEQGLLGLAFHPNHETNRRLYVYFTNKAGTIVIREYRTRSDNRDVVDTGTARNVLVIPHPDHTNHNGGMLAFGRGGYLFIGTGDGGGSGDPERNAQDKGSLLGKMLRINVDTRTGSKAYGIPSSNPYVGEPGLNEIWQIGLRNPWRFSFDRANGNLWIGDVGQNRWEEIDRAIRTSSGPGKGINWGWRVLEGRHCYSPSTGCSTWNKTMPIVEYFHENGRCSVTGGYVYRGTAIPALVGGYLFADFCSGEIWVTTASASSPAGKTLLLDTNHQISSFGESATGELYLVAHGGTVYQIVQG